LVSLAMDGTGILVNGMIMIRMRCRILCSCSKLEFVDVGKQG
jgi:hypothetical protein